MRAHAALVAAALVAGCAPAPAIRGPVAIRDVGILESPPGTSGRDGGYSARFGGHSVWVFGDTFFAEASADGYHWRASTASLTDDSDAADNLAPWTHLLGADGKPASLVPHTDGEQRYNDAHNGERCSAGTDCGARHTTWPGALAVDPASGGALLFYTRVETLPTGPFSFRGTGTSLARWSAPDRPADRPSVKGGPDGADPTLLFGADEPPWGAAALVEDGLLYTWACPGGHLSAPCRLARVRTAEAFDRAAWRFWDGTGWASDWRDAEAVLDGAPIMSVHFSPHLGAFVAFYMDLGSHLRLRTAPRPEGPWSKDLDLGEGEKAPGDAFDYGLVAHPELAREGGRIEYVTYHRPGAFLDGVMRLVEVRLP